MFGWYADAASEGAMQWGLITAEQLASLNVGPGDRAAALTAALLVETGTPGVMRFAGAPESPSEGVRACWLSVDPARSASQRLRGNAQRDLVVSHRSAALLHQLGNLPADIHEFSSATRKLATPDTAIIHLRELAISDVTRVDGIPVTTVTRTIVDLASEAIDGGHLADIVISAAVTNQVDLDALAGACDHAAGQYGLSNGRELIGHLLWQNGVPLTMTHTLARWREQGCDVPDPTVRHDSP